LPFNKLHGDISTCNYLLLTSSAPRTKQNAAQSMITLFIYKLFSQNCNFLRQIAVVPDNGAVYLHIQHVSTDLPTKKEKKIHFLCL